MRIRNRGCCSLQSYHPFLPIALLCHQSRQLCFPFRLLFLRLFWQSLQQPTLMQFTPVVLDGLRRKFFNQKSGIRYRFLRGLQVLKGILQVVQFFLSHTAFPLTEFFTDGFTRRDFRGCFRIDQLQACDFFQHTSIERALAGGYAVQIASTYIEQFQ